MVSPKGSQKTLRIVLPSLMVASVGVAGWLVFADQTAGAAVQPSKKTSVCSGADNPSCLEANEVIPATQRGETTRANKKQGVKGKKRSVALHKVKVKGPTPSQSQLDQLALGLEDKLLKSRRFTLLSRSKEDLGELEIEQTQFGGSGGSRDAHQEAVSSFKRADYVISPVVTDFSFNRIRRPIPGVNSSYTHDEAVLQLDTTIKDVQTGEIVASFRNRASRKTPRVTTSVSGSKPANSLFVSLSEEVIEGILHELIETAFPMTILQVVDGELFIGRGNDGELEEGMELVVFRQGEQLRDQYTNEVLGRVSKKIGLATITRVDPKISVATFKPMGDLTPEKGDILRSYRE